MTAKAEKETIGAPSLNYRNVSESDIYLKTKSVK
jgi:hypothetical protein